MSEPWALKGPGKSGDIRVRVDRPDAVAELARGLKWLWRMEGPPQHIVCIGTDRSTGDALGPLVGTALCRWSARPFSVLGTIDHPVHATNLHGELRRRSNFRNERVLAVDASLGRLEDIGLITAALGPLRPGAGVNKELPALGHYHLAGTVNVGGFMEYFVLQNTRLSLVIKMAEIIASAIQESLRST